MLSHSIEIPCRNPHTKEASYAQKKPNHAAHQGSGTHSPPGRTALLGLAALFGPATRGKNKGKTGQGISAANFSPATQMPTHAAHQGGGTHSPQGLATLLSGAGVFGSNTEREKKKSREYGAWHKCCQILSAQGPQIKKEAAIAHGVYGASPSHQMVGAWSRPEQVTATASNPTTRLVLSRPSTECTQSGLMGRPETPKQRSGARPRGMTRRPPTQPPRGMPSMQPTREVAHAAPKGRGRCLDRSVSAADFFWHPNPNPNQLLPTLFSSAGCSNQPRPTIFREEPASMEALPIFSWPWNASSRKRPH